MKDLYGRFNAAFIEMLAKITGILWPFLMKIQNITLGSVKCKPPALGVFEDSVEDTLKALWRERNNTDVIR